MTTIEEIQYETVAPYPRLWRGHAVPSTHSPYGENSSWSRYSGAISHAQVVIRLDGSATFKTSEEKKFADLVEHWRRDTAVHSSLVKKVMHPAYQRIIGMGPRALPLILAEMKRRPGHWFWALDAITQGESPAKDCESLTQATLAWIKWGEAQGYV